ncbi:hypothetical protein H3U50_04155 [Lactobacillus sp. M0398]|uniref:hypothetical protein n=1 Tax=unclassified Lactobacillus TaxID=2620435 RepID=UPI0018DBC1D8|nr:MULTISPECIES: hypothetical protein [unclassified Lactobacillus]MBI0121008.1 hypothetical protein [Lactobacillus sp. M0398]MBI0123155.1 hypothetical protein [Lactobacillus sp. W8174]MBI0135323.1 hypothetical protein [Lactobacillus sp. W8173]
MQYKKPFYKKIWVCFVVVFITFFTNFVSGNIGIQNAQQTVIAKSTKVVKSNAKKGVTEKVTVKRRKVTRKRKQKRRKGIAKRNVRKVYIAPNSGRRYHFNPNCRGLRRAHRNITKMSLKRAISQGYTLCKWED